MFRNITTQVDFNDFMVIADNQMCWDAMEPEEWEAACEFAGINYHDYEDPDKMWRDLCRAWEE